MGEYGNDLEDELDSHETNKEVDEIKGEVSKSEELDENLYSNKEIEDPFDEFVSVSESEDKPDDPFDEFIPDREAEDKPNDPFDEFVPDKELEDKLDDLFDEFNNFNPKEEIEDLFVECSNQDLVPDNKKDILENIEDTSNDNNFDKEFLEGIDEDNEKKNQDKDFIEDVENELKQYEAKSITLNQQKYGSFDEKDYKKQLNEELQEKFKDYHEHDVNKSKEYIDNIKEYLKQVNWSDISKDWKIQVYIGSRYKAITLNPYQNCSKSNPLYKHKKWLKWVYTNKELNLNDISIAKICGNINNKTIGNWREKFGIPRKVFGNYIKDGYRFLYMPREYKHPEFNPTGDRRIYRSEHIIVMEDHLNKVLTSEELSRHPCLIKNDDKFYIKNGSIVHHINYIRIDNRIENLWLYKNDREHHNSNINECLSSLIKLNQVLFSDGNYYLNHDYDYRNLNIEKKRKVRTKFFQ